MSEPMRVSEVVISPGLQMAVLELDGASHAVLRVVHPRYGALDFILPDVAVQRLQEQIGETILTLAPAASSALN